MKKWLVGLMAAGLCAASAWAEGTATLPVAENYTSTQSWTALTGFSGSGVGTYGDGRCKFDSNNDWLMVQFDGEPGELSFDLKGNSASSGTAPAKFLVEESADAETWSQLANLDETAISSSEYASFSYSLSSDTRYVRWTYANKYGFNFGLNNVAISSGGPVAFSITLDPAEAFEVVQGKEASITAAVKGAQGDVTYSWSVNGTPIDLTGNVYAIDSSEVGGPYEVACEASDRVSDPVSASVSYSVVEAPVITGDQLTRETTGVTGNSYKDWTAEGASGTKYAGNSAGSNDSIQLNTTSPKGIVITESAGKDVASVTVEWNDATADKRSIEIFGSTTAYAGPADLYGDAKGTSLGEIAKGNTTLAVPEGYPYIGILAKGGALYLTSVTIGFAGEAGLSVSLDKANGFTVDLGTADSITATAKNGTEPYSYVWTSGTAELNGEGATLAIPDTLAEGEYTVQVEVTDADSNKASKQIGFTVAAPLEPHAINIAVGIQNGTVTSDPEGEAVKGTQVKLTATATTEGYALKEMTVTYGETVLTFATSPATFEMPDEAVSVGAVFAEVKDYAELPFVGEDTPYSGPWKGASVNGMTSTGLGNDYTSGGAVGARLDDTGDWLQIKFQGTAGELSYGIKGNSLSEEKPSTFKVQESADGETWSDLATYKTGDNLTGSTVGYTNEVSASSQFVRFFYQEKGAGNVGIYDVYISSGGPAKFSISLDPAKYFEVEVDAEATITATPKNAAEGDVHYAWTVGGESAGSDSAVLGLDTSAATDAAIEVVCTATDAAGAEATAKVSYKVNAPAQKFTVSVADGILNGTVQLSIGGSIVDDPVEVAEGTEVTVVATATAGYKLDKILLNGEELTANPFAVTGDAWVTASFVEITGVTYTRVEKAEDFEEGAEYLIVAFSKDKFTSALKNEASGSRIGVEEVVIAEDNTVTTDSDAIVWTIQAGAKDGEYVLYNAAKKVYAAATKDDNVAQLLEDGTAALAQWTLKFDEAAMPKVGIWSVSYPERWLSRNSTAANAYFATYKGSGTAPYLFKKGGAAKPSISYTGETEVTIPGSFSIQFTLKNYDGSFTWANDGREGGEISAEGLYTWTPSEEGEVTITVKAMDGETEIASKSVALTVKKGEEPPPPSVTLTCEPASVTMAVGGSASVTVTLTGAELDGGYIYFEGYESEYEDESPATFDLADFELAEGEHTLVALAVDGSGEELARTELKVTVSGEGPQPGDVEITELSVDSKGGTLSFKEPSGTYTVESTKDLVNGPWEAMEVPAAGGYVTVPLADGPRYYRVATP